MRIGDGSSDVCSSDLVLVRVAAHFAIVLDADHGHRFTAARRVEHAGFERLPDRRRRLRLRDRSRPCRGGVGGGFLAGRERGTLRVQHDAGDEEEGNCWDHDWNQGAHPGSPARKGREEKPARTAEGAGRHARGTTTTRNGAGEHRDAPNVAYGPPTLRLACTVTPCWINDDAPLFCATTMIPAAAFELPFIALDMSKLQIGRAHV